MYVSKRILSYSALLVAYASIALYLSDDSAEIAWYGLPIVLSSLVAAVPRWNSPRANALAGASAFVPVCLLSIDAWAPATLALSLVQLVVIAVYAMVLAEEGGPASEPALLTGSGEEGLVPDAAARSILARELRRSRRTRAPLSLLLLRGIGDLEPAERRELIGLLTAQRREFDTVFATSPDELGVLCIDTDRSGAQQYVARLRRLFGVRDFSIVSFPEDAVTSQGLIDLARRSPERQRRRSDPAVLAD